MRIKKHKLISFRRAQQVCDAVWVAYMLWLPVKSWFTRVRRRCDVKKSWKINPWIRKKYFIPVAIAQFFFIFFFTSFTFDCEKCGRVVNICETSATLSGRVFSFNSYAHKKWVKISLHTHLNIVNWQEKETKWEITKGNESLARHLHMKLLLLQKGPKFH